MFKILNNIDLTNKDKLFEMATSQTTRGHPLTLFERRSRLNLRANNFSLRVIDKWNALPANVVLAPSVDSFKSRLNKHWHGHPLKFEAACYTPGEPRTIVAQGRNASSLSRTTVRKYANLFICLFMNIQFFTKKL